MMSRRNHVFHWFAMPIVAAIVIVAGPSPCSAQWTVYASSGQPPAPQTDHFEKALAAIDLAVMAADCGLVDVSIEAVERAVAKGPPVRSVNLSSMLSHPAQPTAFRPSQVSSSSNARAQLAQRLLDLDEAWVEHEIEPARAYTVWKNCCFPADRPGEAFVYSSQEPPANRQGWGSASIDEERPEPTKTGLHALAAWAQRADRLDDLGQLIAERSKAPTARAVATVLQMIQAGDGSANEKESICRAVAGDPALFTDAVCGDLLVENAWGLLEQLDATSQVHQDLADVIYGLTRSRANWNTSPWLKYLVGARVMAAIENGDLDEFQQAAEMSLSRYDALTGNAQYVQSMEAALFFEAAEKAFELDQVELAVDCLKRYGARNPDSRYGGRQASALIQSEHAMPHLLKLAPEVRWELLGSIVWNDSTLCLAGGAVMNFTDPVPEFFRESARATAESTPRMWGTLTTEQSHSFSLLEWLIRDAVKAGKLADVQARIDKLVESGSDNARLAKIVLAKAQGEPLELGDLLAETDDDENQEPTLLPALGSKARLSPLDVDILAQALRDEEYRAPALRLMEKFFEQGLENGHGPHHRWLRQLKVIDDRQHGIAPPHHECLKHWCVGEDVTAGDFTTGHVPTTLWVERESGVWGLETSPDISYLLLRYPIVGDFTVAFDAMDGPYGESGVFYGGTRIDFERYRNNLSIKAFGERNARDVQCEAIKEEDYSRYQLQRKGDQFTISIGDEFQQSWQLDPAPCPFFALATHRFRRSQVKNVEFAGEPTVLEQVELLSDDLIGWSARFKRQRLATIDVLPAADPPVAETELEDEEEQENLHWVVHEGVLTSQEVPEPEPESDEDQPPEKPKNERPKREALIYYVRPLCDGDELSCEFYYEPGKYSLAPAIGRIALLLDEPTVGLHWITADPTGLWMGVDDQNRVVDEQAEQLQPIELLENDWNALRIRLDRHEVTLILNGTEVYRRRWEPAAGRQFGLFHDPTKYHVQVRNVVLTGNWPDKLPEDLFEKL